MSELLTCSDCKEEKDTAGFAKNPAISRGRDYICKACTKQNRLIRKYSSMNTDQLEKEKENLNERLAVVTYLLEPSE